MVLRLTGQGTGGDPLMFWNGSVRLATFPVGAKALSFVIHTLNRTAIDRTQLLAIHAGALSVSGRGLLLPGEQNVGKTTLTAGLVRAGCGYLTDEAAAFPWDGLTLVPYPKPLALSQQSLAALGLDHDLAEPVDRHVSAHELRPDSLGAPCLVSWVVFPRYDAAATTHLAPIGRGEAVMELAKNTFRFPEASKRALAHLAKIAQGARCFQLVSADLREAVDLVLDMIDRDAGESVTSAHDAAPARLHSTRRRPLGAMEGVA